MNEQLQSPASSEDRNPPEGWLLPIILLLFVGSGCAALIYEVVWLQLLQLVIGSSSVSLGVLLGTFMGGMCLGSVLLPRLVSARHHPLLVYAVIEIGIGVIGLLILWLMPLISGFYTAFGGTGIFGLILRGFVAALCLLPPTFLMGATLPAVARWVKTTRIGVSWMGFFYGGNIAGAVFGTLFAGFYLLRVHDMSIATYVAAAINFAVAALAFALTRVSHYQPGQDGGAAETLPQPVAAPAFDTRFVYVAIGVSGMCALGAEVIWTRTLGFLLGGSAYTFSIILAVFLVGLGVGSSVGSMLSRIVPNPRAALGWCQVLAAAGIAWSAFMLSESLPYWPINPSLSADIWYTFQMDLARAFWPMLPAALMWGASFPLALAAIARDGQDSGRLVGGVYAANTLGAVTGAVSASMLLVVWIGSQHAQQVFVVLSALTGLVLLWPWERAAIVSGPRALRFAAPAVAVVVGGAMVLVVPPASELLVSWGRNAATSVGLARVLYMGEGMNSSVAITEQYTGTLSYHNAGKIQASSELRDMRLQRMLGHLTTLLLENPRSVVVIGCGAGVTAGAVSIDPRLEKLTIAEIEPLVPKAAAEYFGEYNFDVVRNPKTHVHIDDARHFIMTTDEKFDAITSDPLDPWVKGAATLYTKEFFEAAKERLNPGGVVTLFVQLYESNLPAVKSEVATFFEVFPNGAIFGNTYLGEGYDMVLIGFNQDAPAQIDVAAIDELMKSSEFVEVAESLHEVNIHSAVDLFSTYAGRPQDLDEWFEDAIINRDRNLKLQYLAGLGLHMYEGGSIYSDLIEHREYPEGLFVGTEAQLRAIRSGMRIFN